MTRQGFIIAVVLALLGIRACIPSHSQVMLPHRHGASSTTSTPSFVLPTNGLRYHWVASDLSSSPVTTWTDRIQGLQATNTGSARPTWSTNGVAFNGTSQQLLMASFATHTSGSNEAWLVVMEIDKVAANQVIIGNALSGGQLFLYQNNTNLVESGNGTMLFPVTATNVYDFFTCATNVGGGATTYNAYLNGVHKWAESFGWGDGVNCDKFGGGNGNGFWNGVLKEIAAWTNVIFSPADAAYIHSYATNTYGYSP